MKMVIAYVQSYVAEKVITALQSIPEIPGVSMIEVKGFGRGRGKGEFGALAAQTGRYGMLRKIRIETMIPDSLEDRVLEVIRESALTGHLGDGKVYVVPLERAMRIRTGEQGEAAL